MEGFLGWLVKFYFLTLVLVITMLAMQGLPWLSSGYTLVRVLVFFIVVSLSFCWQTAETGGAGKQIPRVPRSSYHIQLVSGVLARESGAGGAQACLPCTFLHLTHSPLFLSVWLSFSLHVDWLIPSWVPSPTGGRMAANSSLTSKSYHLQHQKQKQLNNKIDKLHHIKIYKPHICLPFVPKCTL